MLDWKRTIQILVVIFVIGAGLRFYHLGENSFVADEFLDINASYGYHQTEQWRAWDFNFGQLSQVNENMPRDERAVPYKWQVAALFQFFSPTEAVARSISALWGCFTILVVFWSAWIFTARRDISLVAALLSALSVSAIIFSRRLRMYAMFFPLYLTAATALYGAYEKEYRGKSKLLRTIWQRFGLHLPYLLLGGVALGLSLSVHQLSLHLPIALGVYLVIRLVMTYQETKTWQNAYGYSVMAGLVGVVLVAIMFPSITRSFTAGLVFFDDHFGYLNHALNDFSTPVIGALLMGLGFWSLYRKEQRASSLYLAVAYLVPLLMAIFLWRRNVGPQYIFFIQSFGMILAAAGIVAAVEAIRRLMATQPGPWQRRIIFTLVFLVVINVGYFFQENNTYHETSSGGNPNYRKVFAYVKKEKIENDVLITRNFRNYYWSGAKMSVFDFGGELSDAKLSLADIQKIETEHPSGWFIYSGNDEDYISAEVERYIEKNWDHVSNANVRGDITVYRWGKIR